MIHTHPLFATLDPFRLCVAVVPLALYLLLLGGLNLRRRPTVVSGGIDLAALACGIVGLAAIGPLELFLPEAVGSVIPSVRETVW